MKQIRIVQTVFLLSFVALLTSCAPGREYRTYPPPPPHGSVSLIIQAGPGMVISHYPDGRYYYRSPNGYIYWRGYNNRYYLDRKYIKPFHNHRQYNDWKRYHNRRR
jgi:hypothetical protein